MVENSWKKENFMPIKKGKRKAIKVSIKETFLKCETMLKAPNDNTSEKMPLTEICWINKVFMPVVSPNKAINHSSK